MAFVSNMDDEEQKQGPVAPVSGGAVHLAPSSGVGSTGAGAPTTGQAPAAGGQFASLDKYVNANQGQAQPLADKITGGINDQYNSLNQGNRSTLQNLSGQVSSAYTPNDPSVLAKESADPVSFASDAGNVKAFQGLLNNNYSGPTSAESTSGFQTQQAKVNDAIAKGQTQTQTDAGRQQLVSQQAAVPTKGVTALNSAILSQDPNALSKVQDAYKPFSSLVSGLTSGAADINTQIARAQADATAANQAANQALAGQTSGLNAATQKELDAAQSKYNDYNTKAGALTSSLQNGQLPTGYGVDKGLNDFLANNVSHWIAANAPGQTVSYNFANAIPQQTSAAAPTLATAVSPDNYKMFDALTQLSGGQPIASPLAGLDRSQAGTYKMAGDPTVDNKALAGDLSAGLSTGLGGVNVGSAPFNQFLGLLQALNLYQGNGQNAWGAGPYDPNMHYAPGAGQTFGSLVPTIQ